MGIVGRCVFPVGMQSLSCILVETVEALGLVIPASEKVEIDVSRKAVKLVTHRR